MSSRKCYKDIINSDPDLTYKEKQAEIKLAGMAHFKYKEQRPFSGAGFKLQFKVRKRSEIMKDRETREY